MHVSWWAQSDVCVESLYCTPVTKTTLVVILEFRNQTNGEKIKPSSGFNRIFQNWMKQINQKSMERFTVLVGVRGKVKFSSPALEYRFLSSVVWGQLLMKTEEIIYQHWYFEMWAMSVLMSVSDLHFSCREPCRFQRWGAASAGCPGDVTDACAWNSYASPFHLTVPVGARQPPLALVGQYCKSLWTNFVSVKVNHACL